LNNTITTLDNSTLEPLEAVDGQAQFTCDGCGECCNRWTIPIDADKVDALLQKPWVRDLLDKHRKQFEPTGDGLYTVPHALGNVCIFLSPEKRCMIECEEGAALKPTECIRYPFATTQDQLENFYFDSSASCKRIAEHLIMDTFLPVVPPVIDEVLRSDVEILPEKIRVSPFRKMKTKDVLSEWDVMVRNTLQTPNMNSLEVLGHLENHLFFSRPARTRYNHAPWWLPFFLRKPYGMWSLWQILTGQAYHDPSLWGLPVNLRAVAAVVLPPEEEHHIKSFVHQILTRKRLLTRGASLQSLIALSIIAIHLVHWHAKILAVLNAAPNGTDDPITVDKKDISLAIRLVERYYTGHQPRFLVPFTNPLWSWFLLHVL